MDRAGQSEDQRETAVPAGRDWEIKCLLCAGERARRKPGVDANDR